MGQRAVDPSVEPRRRPTALRSACISSGAAAITGFVAAMVVLELSETLLSSTLPIIVDDLAAAELRSRHNAVAPSVIDG